MTMSISRRQRRELITRRHHLAADAASAEQVASALVALHATDPATVFLSVLARSRTVSLADVLTSLYDDRTLVRWMAMRRTLFVLPRSSVPMVQAAASAGVAATLRRKLIIDIQRGGTDPVIDGDVGAWLTDVEAGVQRTLAERGSATGVQLSAAEPRLRTAILPGGNVPAPINLTSRLLVLMGTEATLVRGAPTGGWTSRRHQWEAVGRWWPDGLPVWETAAAQAELVRVWIAAFGPAPVTDLEWWTGWTKTTLRAALPRVPTVEVDLDGEPGLMLADRAIDAELAQPVPAPVVTLLPALDPTPMGWKRRDWFFGIDQAEVFDRNGNIGPTAWWDGEIVGGWAIGADGEVRTKIIADRGAEVAGLAERAAAELQSRLGGAIVTPSFRTPLEKALLT